MSGPSITNGLFGDTAEAHLPGAASSLDAGALAEAMKLALENLREALNQLGVNAAATEKGAALSRQLQSIAGVLRFCGAHSLYSLCELMREVVVNFGDPVSSAGIQALNNGCSVLMASVPSLQRGRAIPAGWLLPVWRELAAHLPGPPPSASAMISLASLGESEAIDAARAFLCSHNSVTSLHEIATPAIDKMLLDLLRANPGSGAWRDSLDEASTLILYVKQNIDDRRDRLYWAVMLVYCELLAADAPMDITLAKKNLSSAIRVIRHSAQQSFLFAAALPDSLVREVLFQIGLFAPLTATSQSVRDSFMLDWQLSPCSEANSIEAVNKQKYQLLSYLDELEAVWTQTGPAERHQKINMIAVELEAVSVLRPLASSVSSLLSLLAVEAVSDLPIVAALLILRLAVEACEGVGSATQMIVYLQALEIIFAQASRAGVSEKQWWDTLASIATGMQRQAAISALRDTVQSVLRDTEQKLEAMFESGYTIAALHEMILSVDRAAGALKLAGMTTAVRMAEVLRHEIDAAERASLTAGTSLLTDKVSSLALQWVQLCDCVDACSAADDPASFHDDLVLAQGSVAATGMPAEAGFAAPPVTVSPLPTSADLTTEDLQDAAPPSIRLEQIFIQEATQRLCRLQQALTGWVNNMEEGLPAAIADEAHGLAGSAATVGRQRLHDGAIVIEQLVDHLRRLPPASQHIHADALLLGVQALEHELQSTPCDDLSCTAGHKDTLIVNGLSALSVLLRSLSEHSHEPMSVHDPESDAADHHDASRTSDITSEALAADVELLAVFSEEAAELLPMLAQQMHNWFAMPQDEKLCSGVLRLLHTLKGSARMAGEMMLGERLHQMEHEVSQLARTDSPPAHGFQTLRRDIAQLLEEVGLMPLLHSEPAETTTIATALATPALLSELPAVERSPTETVSAAPKLRNDLLERASSGAAELLVGAVRANEELQRQRQTVSELAENLVRLRTQLRELELQSESRITAHAQPSASTFDPLEFDRYTRLQELTRMTAESLADLTSLQRSLGRQADSATAMMSHQIRYARSLQSDLRRAGMQAFSGIELRFRHLVRQTASETDREVRFEIDGAEIEIDRQQLDRLSAALQHLIRNAIVHGIEPPQIREQAGKPRCGVVRLSLGQQGSELRLQISDDGKGLDLARIRARACALGILDEDAVIEDAQLAELIFHPGLSTADEITGLAGRGIGMDAVKEAVTQMGGALKVDSLRGAGTCITLGLPQLLSTQQVLVVSSSTQTVALPASMVQQLMQMNDTILQHALQTGSIEWQRQTMPVRNLDELLGVGSLPAAAASVSNRPSVVILRQLDQWLAITVNEVVGHREVVVKQVGLQLASVTGLAGATLQADGGVLLIMNPLQWFDPLAPHRRAAQLTEVRDQIFDNAPLVMVVDDSLTVRRVSQRLLERQGYRVIVARHGIEALEKLRDITPVAILLDIEMPRMDGFELLSRLRADARLTSVPVAMVTSRAAERHRSYAMQLGANAYFGKPYRDQELFDWLASSVSAMPKIATAA